MKTLKRSQFIEQMYCVASQVNLSLEENLRHYPKDEEEPDFLERYYAFIKLREREVVGRSHGWVAGEGFSKKCPIVQAVLFLAGLKRCEDMVSMKEVAGNAMILLEYVEAAWEEYEILLKQHREMIAGVLQVLHAVAEDNADRAGLRH